MGFKTVYMYALGEGFETVLKLDLIKMSGFHGYKLFSLTNRPCLLGDKSRVSRVSLLFMFINMEKLCPFMITLFILLSFPFLISSSFFLLSSSSNKIIS